MEVKKKRIAFIVAAFPVVSETWLINQVADLLDSGFEIDIFALAGSKKRRNLEVVLEGEEYRREKGDAEVISERYFEHRMGDRTHYISMPDNRLERIVKAIPKVIKLLFKSPRVLFRALNIKKYGGEALTLKLLFWTEPFAGKKFDLFHCHFGTVANKFLKIRDILGIKQKFITSFYGYDVSSYTKQKGPRAYDRLKRECSWFIVMSNNMKGRVVAQGFDEDKIHVLPISIDVDSYPFTDRSLNPGETIQIVSVGRFVEKKGFDDLLRALAIVKRKTKKKFVCNIIGGGPLESRLRAMTSELNLEDVVSYKGYMKVEKITDYFRGMHLYMQLSKTAPDGDME